ncbi:alpha/beta fold hydrolase [Streptomyces sp. G5(2025)]|uniref:alpha/beta fold hydrolase n=1 Tax=Streptomyces sp. G5(2025) TaxID=3406628 RepID=UPI003C29FC85
MHPDAEGRRAGARTEHPDAQGHRTAEPTERPDTESHRTAEPTERPDTESHRTAEPTERPDTESHRTAGPTERPDTQARGAAGPTERPDAQVRRAAGQSGHPDARPRPTQNDPHDALALVLLHGLTGPSDWWEPVVPVLARAHRVVRLDLAGHGGSARPSGSGGGVPVHVRRVAAALDELGVRRAIVAGHSTGGLVGTALAEQRPDLVGALALFDTGPPDSDVGLAQRWPGRLVTVPVLGRWVWRMLGDAPGGQVPATAAARETDIPDRIVMRVRGMTYLAATAASRDAFDCLGQRELPERLSTLDIPLLAVLGSEDSRRRRRSADRYRAVPGLRLEFLHGVGDAPAPVAPRRAADLLLAFLSGVGSGVRRTPG